MTAGWKDDVWLILDIETTSAEDDCEIVEIGMVWMAGGQSAGEEQIRVRPTCPIPAEATAIHGISDDDVRDCPTIGQVALRVQAAVANADVIVTYNGWHFDLPILARLVPGFRDACRGKVNLDVIKVVRLDRVGRYWRGQGRHRLVSAARHSGVDVDESRAHGAVYDCEIAGLLLHRWAGVLPDDGMEAQRWLMAEGKKQDERFAAWLAQQPPREATP